jgi:hypothetical protein
MADGVGPQHSEKARKSEERSASRLLKKFVEAVCALNDN